MARMVVDNVCCFISPLNPPKGEVGPCYFDVCCLAFGVFVQKVPDLPYGRQRFNLFEMLNFIQKQTC